MRARRPGRHSDEVMGPRALAAMADAARRSREAGVGVDRASGTHPEVLPPPGGSAAIGFAPAAAGTRASAPSRQPGPRPHHLRHRPDRVHRRVAITHSRPATPKRPGCGRHLGGATSPASARLSRRCSIAWLPGHSGRRRPGRPARTVTHGDHRRRSSLLIVSVSLMAIVAALLATWAVKDSGGSPSSSVSPAPSTHIAPDAPRPPRPVTKASGSFPGHDVGYPVVTTTTHRPPRPRRPPRRPQDRARC